jgi:DNA polymerase-3 subunit epsilon
MSKQPGFHQEKAIVLSDRPLPESTRTAASKTNATLLNPEGRDTGAVFVHGISNDADRNAPLFSDVVADVLTRLDAVVVAHNARFEERFMAAEFARAGVRTPPMPALCSLWLGQQTFDTPNHKLGTLAQHAGIPLVDAHAALGDVRATAALLPLILDRYRPGIEFDTTQRAVSLIHTPWAQ